MADIGTLNFLGSFLLFVDWLYLLFCYDIKWF